MRITIRTTDTFVPTSEVDTIGVERKYEIDLDDKELNDFLVMSTTFMRRFLTGQYPPLKVSR